jgi:hypothetical protein
MKLIIKRDQKQEKGLFGGDKGMKFLLSCRTELTPEEQSLIKKYKAEQKTLGVISLGEDPTGLLSINDLIIGKTYECKDVITLLDVEDKVKKACENFKTLLVVMDSFGGEEVIEY